MADKFRKIEREYVLSDSTVNEYGFRLLTSGYQLDDFQKNPIGYYMHRREEGIALKWENLRVEDDKIVGIPVINLSNSRGEQLCDEAENGFLNAASVGHIVVLEYSLEPELMLPGQTGPTITKWYNKECSLVDIPGNSNALCRLYDAQEQELNLVDLGIGKTSITISDNTLLPDISNALQLAEGCDAASVITTAKNLLSRTHTLEAENDQLRSDKQALEEHVKDLVSASNKQEVTSMLDRALEDRKLTVELRNRLAGDYAENPEGLKILLAAMPAYRSISEHLKLRTQEQTEARWQPL